MDDKETREAGQAEPTMLAGSHSGIDDFSTRGKLQFLSLFDGFLHGWKIKPNLSCN